MDVASLRAGAGSKGGEEGKRKRKRVIERKESDRKKRERNLCRRSDCAGAKRNVAGRCVDAESTCPSQSGKEKRRAVWYASGAPYEARANDGDTIRSAGVWRGRYTVRGRLSRALHGAQAVGDGTARVRAAAMAQRKVRRTRQAQRSLPS